MNEYPKRRNGNEYYPKGCKGFVQLMNGGERYALDCRGNELYPKRKENVFARDKWGREYYAKEKNGDEMYPLVNKQSLFIIDPQTMSVKVARNADGKEKYPRDSKDNEYYLRKEQVPFLLKDKQGEPYLAQSRQGHNLIPWNVLQDYMDGEKPYVHTKDAGGNSIYTDQSNLHPLVQILVRCVCQVMVICPPVAGLVALLI